MTDWFSDELHSMSEAREPGVKPVPANVMASPPARPLQMGMEGLELSHVTPGADVVSLSAVVAAVALVTLVVNKTPPATTARIPTVASSLEVRLTRSTFPPQFGPPTAGPLGLALCY